VLEKDPEEKLEGLCAGVITWLAEKGKKKSVPERRYSNKKEGGRRG